MPFTMVAFHAHPDDESLLMGGTMARASCEGHRVVLVVATDGAAGLSAMAGEVRNELGRLRQAELEVAAAALSIARVIHLGYPDGSFAHAGLEGPAASLARIVAEESADVLTGYDPAGGYGHPDHVHVHRVARQVAALEPGLTLLEVSVDRAWLLRGAAAVRLVPRGPAVDMRRLRASYLSAAELTHRVDVRRYLAAKVAALSAHHSQQTGGRRIRTVTVLRSLPRPLARPILGHEWFREVGRDPGGQLLDDIFASLR